MARLAGGPQLPAGRAALLKTPGDRARDMPLRDVSRCRFGENRDPGETVRIVQMAAFWAVLGCSEM